MAICADVMTRYPACCVTTDTVQQAAQLMKSEDVGPIPVVENEQSKKLAGIVTDRDLAIKVVAEGKTPDSVLVQDVMTPNPVTCRPDDDLQSALDAMAANQVRRIPVVDENNSIVGIIAQADVATRTEEPEQVAEVVEEISQPG
jgi:CBS domain-containing protein